MRGLMALVVFAAACVGGQALAADPASQRSTDDYVKAIQAAPCANGYERDEDGLCPAVSGSQKGFSLAAPTQTPAPSRRSGGSTARASAVQPAPRAPTMAPQRSALSDLMITFKLGSAQITDQGQTQARIFASALLNPAIARTRFEIAGHTDASGSPDRGNRALSPQARAGVGEGLFGGPGRQSFAARSEGLRFRRSGASRRAAIRGQPPGRGAPAELESRPASSAGRH